MHFLPGIIFLLKGKLQKPPKFILFLLLIYFSIFAIGIVTTIFDDYSIQPRRVSSYVIFVSIFFYAFILIDKNIIEAFKRAVLLISCFYCLQSLFTFFFYGGNMLGYEQKDVVGSQRYGFVYLFALFILIYDDAYSKLLKSAGITLLIIGSFLTFSRATIVAMIATFLLYLIFEKKKDKKVKKRTIGSFLKGLFFVVLICGVLAAYFPLLLDFFL